MTSLQKITLGIAGVTSLAIGAFMLVAPRAFYAGYGIVLGQDPSLLSELRAPGAALAAFGAVMLIGLVRPALRQASVVSASIVFLAFPAGRAVGLTFDGIPSAGILGALIVELAIGLLCLFAFRHGAGPAISSHAAN